AWIARPVGHEAGGLDKLLRSVESRPMDLIGKINDYIAVGKYQWVGEYDERISVLLSDRVKGVIETLWALYRHGLHTYFQHSRGNLQLFHCDLGGWNFLVKKDGHSADFWSGFLEHL